MEPNSELFDTRAFSRAGRTLPYRLMRPMGRDAAGKYPLHVILHGAAERGTDNEKQVSRTSVCVTPWILDTERTARPAFLLAPQCPPDQEWVAVHWENAGAPLPPRENAAWPGQYLLELIPAICTEFPSIDRDRVYLSGGSMGGVGAWYLCQYRPDLFAAAFPMAGSGDPHLPGPFVKDIPVWTYGAELDEITSVAATRTMVDAIRQAGGHPHYTEVPGASHTPEFFLNAAADPRVHEWLFGQSKARR